METIEVMPIRVRVTSILRKAVLSGEFAPGQELSLSETAARLGVSRTPVREAFQSLAAEGLLELRMNRGAIVTAIDEKFIRDHFAVRKVLECEAVAGAARCGMKPEALEELEQLQRWAEENWATMTAEDYSSYNLRIHTGFWTANGNARLENLLMSLWNGPSVHAHGRDRDHEAVSIQEHGQMLSCVRKHDEEGARQAMASHISRSTENILRSYQFRCAQKEGENKC